MGRSYEIKAPARLSSSYLSGTPAYLLEAIFETQQRYSRAGHDRLRWVAHNPEDAADSGLIGSIAPGADDIKVRRPPVGKA